MIGLVSVYEFGITCPMRQKENTLPYEDVFIHNRGFPVVQLVKNLSANAGNSRYKGSLPGSGRSLWRRKWQPTLVFLPGKFHGQRSLVGYCPWDRKEWNTAE